MIELEDNTISQIVHLVEKLSREIKGAGWPDSGAAQLRSVSQLRPLLVTILDAFESCIRASDFKSLFVLAKYAWQLIDYQEPNGSALHLTSLLHAQYMQLADLAKLSGNLPLTAMAGLGISFTAFRLGAFPEAHEYAGRVLQLDDVPADELADAWRFRGNAEFQLGNIDEAWDAFANSRKFAVKLQDLHREAAALSGFGIVAEYKELIQEALTFHLQSIELKEKVGDRKGKSISLNGLAIARYAQGEFQASIDAYLEAIAIDHDFGDRSGEAVCRGNLANSALALGDCQLAVQSANLSLAIHQELGHSWDEAFTYNILGRSLYNLYELAGAESAYANAVQIMRQLEYKFAASTFQCNLGIVKYLQLEYTDALALWLEALTGLQEGDDPRGSAKCQALMGLAFLTLGDLSSAARSLEASLVAEGSNFLEKSWFACMVSSIAIMRGANRAMGREIYDRMADWLERPGFKLEPLDLRVVEMGKELASDLASEKFLILGGQEQSGAEDALVRQCLLGLSALSIES
jgi:tetratricopeptide (TPR) repeat protein